MKPNAPKPNLQATTDVPLLAGRYSLLNKLGEGGMGAVFHARDTKLDRAVAVKMLPAGSTPDGDAVARFQREAKALARLAHPGIIQAFDSGDEGGRPFLVMELVEGQSLAAVLRDQGRVTPARAADFAYQAALALHHAHQSGLVHRDVKPSNLLLSADGRVRLLDLGLARFLQDQIGDGALTREGVGMGTPDYAAPEQFRDAHKADTRSDIYALGCTLYHLIAGHVPFPGSSLSEKVTAHETKEPTPLEELSPEVPAGMALAVRRMMAKRPADRFHTMAEVAEVLLPHVAGSSASFPQIRTTSTWIGAHLVTMTMRPRRRPLARWLVVGAVAALVLVGVGLVGFAAGWFRPGGPERATITDSQQTKTAKVPGPADKGSAKPPDEANKKDPKLADPNVLTVSKEEKDGGTYRTIGEAMEKIQPHQTLRIVDAAHYREIVLINNPEQHEGIILEAPRGAIIETATDRSSPITINGVQGVVLRNLRLQAVRTKMCALVTLLRACSDITIERVGFSTPSDGTFIGIEMHNIPGGKNPARPNVCVRDCYFHKAQIGIHGFAVEVSPERWGLPRPIHGVALRDNIFTECNVGLLLRGEFHKSHFVANRFQRCERCAYQLEHILEATDDLLIANNTAIDCTAMMRVWDNAARGKRVRIRNNLSLRTSYPDYLYIESANSPSTPKGLGDGSIFHKSWTMDYNWREVTPPAKPPGEPDGWIPPGKGDVCRSEIKGVNRVAKSPHFLRLEAKSKLATEGAGNVDPSLPRYVGALPPEGVEPWDWERAWRMPKDAQLLTVSKAASGGGKYRTINNALKDAKPWATIRVQDAETYDETMRLADRKHEGITLETIKGATLRLEPADRQIINIEDVAHVRVSGFNCSDSGPSPDFTRAFVVVSGTVPGVVLRRLTLTSKSAMYGLVLQNAVATSTDPLRIEHCTIRPALPRSNDGILLIGKLDKEPAGRIVIRSNRIFNSNRGINLQGTLRDIHVVGNLLVNCPASGVQVEDLSPTSHGLLLANNTAFGGQGGLRVFDNSPYEQVVAGQVECANNLIFAASHCDMAYILAPGQGKDQSAGDSKAILKLWSFHHNRRDFSGANAAVAIPAGPDDTRLKSDDLLARDADDLDRVRPAKDSPLASQGAGTKDSALPAYIGALPREGEPSWDWDRTWQARVRKVEDKK